MEDWKGIGVRDWLFKTLNILSLSTPTPIQSNLIPAILKGRNVIGSAKTGSGKTMAFAIPILQSKFLWHLMQEICIVNDKNTNSKLLSLSTELQEDPFGVFSLVLTPTRELAYQIAEQFRIIGAEIDLKVCVVVGGMDMMSQAIELAKKPHIVIATPGRLVDHIQSSSNAIFFKRIKFLVLDEADRLLDSGFDQDLSIIKGALGPQGSFQSILVSATITTEIESMKFGDGRGEPFVFTSERYFTLIMNTCQILIQCKSFTMSI